ncbi:MAG: glycosyltransferase family 39 protein [Chloroflexi bacterium]|nr:glycosyltransferase family 39 protein [Chloroflexota bacterium]
MFVLTFSARTVGLSLFVTPDEDNWMRRTGNFAQALRQGDLARTFQSGHPGVTTMWIARAGIGPDAERLAGITTQDNPVTRTPGFMDLLVRARLAMILVNSLLLVGIVGLAARLLGLWPALIGGVILALDPFLAAHGQVVHVDGLSAGFMTLAMLAAGVYWWARGGIGYLILCGIAAGLAVLTKAPSLVLGVLVPAVALSAPLVDREAWPWPRVVRMLLLAGAVGVAVVFLLWPTLWVAPMASVERFVRFTLETSSEHRPGNFFLGQPVADPGPWYYPVAVMFRISPLALAGMIALAVLLPPAEKRRPTLLLLLTGIGFILFISLAGKKLDRYTLPIFPSLDLLAGLGLWTMGEWIAPYIVRAGLSAAQRSLLAAGALVALTIGQAIPLAMVAPYPLAYYNPLVGGGPAAGRMILVGWAEGLDQVADYLNAQPNPERQLIAVYFPLELNFQGMVKGTVTQFGDPRPVTHVVDYVNAAQRGHTPPEVAGVPPVKDVWINGILYARVYQLDPPRRVR